MGRLWSSRRRGGSRVPGFPREGSVLERADQLCYARFHMGNGTADDGSRVLTPASLVAMRSNPGPAVR